MLGILSACGEGLRVHPGHRYWKCDSFNYAQKSCLYCTKRLFVSLKLVPSQISFSMTI